MKLKFIIVRIVVVIVVGLSLYYFSPKIISGLTKTSNSIPLDSLHQPIGKAEPGEWLSIVKEPGQSFEEYVNNSPNRKTEHRNKIYIRPFGYFSDTEKEVLLLTSEYLEIFYDTDVEILDSISISHIPKTFMRIQKGAHQVNAGYILNNILAPGIPEDAVAYIALVKIDLYNESKNNFVFGLGNLSKRVGVYSLARFGIEGKSNADQRKFMIRTLKVASHELGHIFSIKHCTEYKCLMNGSNSLKETDAKPIYLCPIDLKKIYWNVNVKKANRFKQLEMFWNENGFNENSEFYRKSALQTSFDH